MSPHLVIIRRRDPIGCNIWMNGWSFETVVITRFHEFEVGMDLARVGSTYDINCCNRNPLLHNRVEDLTLSWSDGSFGLVFSLFHTLSVTRKTVVDLGTNGILVSYLVSEDKYLFREKR